MDGSACGMAKGMGTHAKGVAPYGGRGPEHGERVVMGASTGSRVGEVWEWRGSKERWVHVASYGTANFERTGKF